METAGLRIKFRPLIHKKTLNNSKCFLEIVPEVSSIRNLDKFIWRQKSNFKIYMIPMTHKVVVQKREAIRDISDTAVKTYHSCVDLLKSSNPMLDYLGSGDVTKIISDTLLLKKCLDNCMSEELSIHGLPDRRKHSDNDLILPLPISQDTTHPLLQLEDVKKIPTKTKMMNDKVQVKTKKSKGLLNVDSSGDSLHKLSNTENVYPIFGDTVQNENVVIKTVTASSFVKRESTRWLSLSPICSVNTYETPFINRIVSSKSVTCKIYESQRDLVLPGSVSSPSDLSRHNQALSSDLSRHNQALSSDLSRHNQALSSDLSRDNQALSRIIDVTRQRSPRILRLLCRTSPEVRVVEYARYIENEMLPLKMWFDDIKRKCTALGFEFSTQPCKKQCMTTNSVSTSSGPETSIAIDTVKSNRAVYKIVFDE